MPSSKKEPEKNRGYKSYPARRTSNVEHLLGSNGIYLFTHARLLSLKIIITHVTKKKKIKVFVRDDLYQTGPQGQQQANRTTHRE